MSDNEKNMVLSSMFFKTGSCVFMLMGLGHFLGTVVDVFTPFLFTPVDGRVKDAMVKGTILITDRTSLWDAWLGFNLSHGLGVFLFGFIFLMLARKDYGLITGGRFILPLCVFTVSAYLALSVMFWFYLPALGCAVVLICYVVSFALARKGRLCGPNGLVSL